MQHLLLVHSKTRPPPPGCQPPPLQEEELAEHASSVDIPSLEAQLSELQSEKGRLDERARALQEELAKVTKQAAARGAVDALRKQKRTVEEEMSNKWVTVRGGLSCAVKSVRSRGRCGPVLAGLGAVV